MFKKNKNKHLSVDFGKSIFDHKNSLHGSLKASQITTPTKPISPPNINENRN